MVFKPKVGDPNLMDKLSDIFSYEARCGMYHVGITSKHIYLAGGDIPTIVLQSGTVTINPHRLVLDMKKHFNHYINQLDKKNSELSETLRNDLTEILLHVSFSSARANVLLQSLHSSFSL